MSRTQACKRHIDSLLLRYGVYDVLAPQPDSERRYLVDTVNEFMAMKPSLKQLEALEKELHKGLIAAAWTASTNIKHMVKSVKEPH